MSEIVGVFATRGQCLRKARREGVKAFRSVRIGNQGYRLVTMPDNNPALDPAIAFAEACDWVSHVEVQSIDEGRQPGTRVVLVVTCFKEEIPDAIPPGVDLEPITPSLWLGDKEAFEHRSREHKATAAGPRAKSDVESPTKLVWKIADEYAATLNPGEEIGKAGRALVIERCIEQGVNKATAQTQYYRWAKSNGK